MLRAVLYGAGDLRLEESTLDVSALGPREIHVETEVTALSTGTDLGNYLGDSGYVPDAPPYPRWVGYSNCGVVRAVGAEVTSVRPGERVFAPKPHQSAYLAREDELVVPAPMNVSPEEVSLIYLANLGMAGLQQVNFTPGEDVAVVGMGVIGLATVALAQTMGARAVIAVANSPLRQAVAQRMGATAAEGAADVVVLTANTWSGYRSAMEMARFRGRVSVLGFPGRGQPAPEFNPMRAEWMYLKQLTVTGTGRALDVRRNLNTLLAWMSQGRLDLKPAISHRFPARRMVEAYDMAKARSKELTAAVFDWRGV
ncbi:MAG: zinc-binding alcohol dehydrogenase [Bryobacteraceae bacterium]